MDDTPKHSLLSVPRDRSSRIRSYMIVAAIAWSGLVIWSLTTDYRASREYVRKVALAEARMALDKDLLYRRWAARRGGFYVQESALTPANPHLAHIPERDITTPSGRRLTLVNPAYMTRQVFDEAKEFSGPRGHIASLNPLWPGNSPDQWERRAIETFAQGRKEVSSYTTIDGKPFFRVMRAFFVESPCLKCHNRQGYKLGDISGGISVAIPLEGLFAAQRADQREMWAFHGLFWIVGLTMIGVGGRRIERDTDALTASHTRLKEQNDELTKSVTERRRVAEEVAILNRTLEERIAERTSQLETANRELTSEISRRAQAQEEICALNRDLLDRTRLLETTNRELESFSYSVSHDLRAPLRHINSFSSILLEDYPDLDPQIQGYLHRIGAASSQMGVLIEDLLALSRVTRTQMSVSTVSLSDLATQISTMLQESEPYRSVTFRIEGGLTVRGDLSLLRQLMQNLLDNAWKYTAKEPGALIEFGSTLSAGEKAFFVRDNGVGFDMQYADKLFAPFQRLHGTEFEGTGVGLATVHRIVQRHGGRIWAESQPGQGATFFFTL